MAKQICHFSFAEIFKTEWILTFSSLYMKCKLDRVFSETFLVALLISHCLSQGDEHQLTKAGQGWHLIQKLFAFLIAIIKFISLFFWWQIKYFWMLKLYCFYAHMIRDTTHNYLLHSKTQKDFQEQSKLLLRVLLLLRLLICLSSWWRR